MSDLQYSPTVDIAKLIARAHVIEEQVANGTYINTIEPRKMHPVDKLKIECKLIELNGVKNGY